MKVGVNPRAWGNMAAESPSQQLLPPLQAGMEVEYGNIAGFFERLLLIVKN